MNVSLNDTNKQLINKSEKKEKMENNKNNLQPRKKYINKNIDLKSFIFEIYKWNG